MSATKPNFGDWPAAALSIFMFSAIGAGLLLLPVNYLYLHTPQGRPPVALRLCSLIPGACFGFWFARKVINKEYWQLTDSALIGGASGKKIYAFSSIEKVIDGLPGLPGNNGLLLCFKNGSRLPLRLQAIADGPRLMTELRQKLNHLLVRDYVYSPEEIRQLLFADINELIPAHKS